jgi:hypothetical protein
MVALHIFVSTCTLCFCISNAMANSKDLQFPGNISYSGQFTYRGNISHSDKSLVISEIAPGVDDVLITYCAVECFNNLDCNAVELCSTATGNVCRLSSSITTSLTSGEGTCSRYELVRTYSLHLIKGVWDRKYSVFLAVSNGNTSQFSWLGNFC